MSSCRAWEAVPISAGLPPPFLQTRFKAEGSRPAPESAYGVACAIDEAEKCREPGEKRTIAFKISGHGFMDMPGSAEVRGLYPAYFSRLESSWTAESGHTEAGGRPPRAS